MYDFNVNQIVASITDSDRVLDVGGWAQPFNRADWVVDLFPYETRGVYGSVGPGPERFTEATWCVHDLNSSSPLPFDDKEFDFVICSHTLEDIRNPLAVVRELARVGKRGYIETPSRLIECCVGPESRRYAGWAHHRWLVEVEHGRLVFRFKSHLLHASRRFYLPKRFFKSLQNDQMLTYLFWIDDIDCIEVIAIDRDRVAQEYAAFVNAHCPVALWERIVAAVNDPLDAVRRALGRTGLPTGSLPLIESR